MPTLERVFANASNNQGRPYELFLRKSLYSEVKLFLHNILLRMSKIDPSDFFTEKRFELYSLH